MTFTSSIMLGGDVICPQEITVDERGVSLKQRNSYLIGYNEISIKREKISSIQIHDKLIGADLTIIGHGGEKLVAVGFALSELKTVKELLTKPE